MKDRMGHDLSGASATSLNFLELGLHELRCYIGDPVATVEKALTESPSLLMGHVLKAYLHLLGTEPAGLPVARSAYDSAQPLPANDRERRHLEAVRLLIDGRWRAAGQVLEDVSIDYPRDGLALQAGHQIDFFTGDSRMLRDRIIRAFPFWDTSMPGYHAVLGMLAFGLEETGDYARAEKEGRLSVELEPRDGWGQHAVAHVMEMQNRRRDGVSWMRSNSAGWSRDSFFAVHNWWHLALFHLGLGEIDEALALFDGPIYGKTSTVVLDMVDASALLWRLHLRGIDVGNRFQALADNWTPIATARNYAFNDMHAMMAFAGANLNEAAEAVLEAQQFAMDEAGDNAAFTREVGRPAALAIRAFGRGEYAETVRLLRPVLVHGSFSDHHTNWEFVKPMLQKRLTVLAIARRGRGETDATEGHSIEDQVNDVVDLIRTIPEPVFLLGHSFGAICSLAAALIVPDRIRKLVLYEPPRPSILSNEAFVRLDSLAAAGGWDEFSVTFFRDTLQVPVEELDQLRATELWPPIVADAKASLQDLRAIRKWEFNPERYRRLQMPVLLQIGSESPRHFYLTDALMSMLPDARIGELPGQAHEGMTTAPEMYADAVLQFLMESPRD